MYPAGAHHEVCGAAETAAIFPRRALYSNVGTGRQGLSVRSQSQQAWLHVEVNRPLAKEHDLAQASALKWKGKPMVIMHRC